MRRRRQDAPDPGLFRAWRTVFCGAEPIRKPSVDTFVRASAPWGFDATALVFCHGLAEAALMTTSHRYTDADTGFRTEGPVTSACLGTTMPELDLRIVDESGRKCAEAEIGAVQLRGATLFNGYDGYDGATDHRVTFDAPGHGDGTGRSATILEYRSILAELHVQYGTFEALVAHSLGLLGSFYALNEGVKAERIVAMSGVCYFDYLVDEFASELRLRASLKDELLVRTEKKLFPGAPADRMPFSVSRATGAITAPILVVHDEEDSRIGVGQGRGVAAAFGDQARMITTRGLGHRPILGAPEVYTPSWTSSSTGPTRRAFPRRRAV